MIIDKKQSININVQVQLGNLTPDDVEVQVVYGTLNHEEKITSAASKVLSLCGQTGDSFRYEGNFHFICGGLQGLTVRVIPCHSLLGSSPDLFLCTWANNT